jgi:Zn finger protein HypA/HybF involved in hydrogenase expression
MRKITFFILFICIFAQAETKSPHGDKLKVDCAVCHVTENWHKIQPNFNHNKTKFPLTGQHKSIGCRKCHISLDFSKAKTECNQCHTDVHQGTTGRDCDRCHSTKSWIVTNTKSLHLEAGFPLRGAHETADCNRCHTSASNLRFDNIRTDCYACHKNKYFATAGKPYDHKVLGFDTDCARCHNMVGMNWNSIGKGFDHSFFPLTGGHNITCNDCHKGGNYKKRLSSDCMTCHSSKKAEATASIPAHSGIFAKYSCGECHTTKTWNTVKYKQHDAHFGIYSGNHKGTWTKCNECHTNNTSYKADCLSCHEHSKSKTDQQHRGKDDYVYNSAACISCHPNGSKGFGD